MPRAAKCRNGLATFHNYSEADVDDVRAFAERCRYLVYGKEVCPTTGTPHIHVVFQLKQQGSITGVHQMLTSGNVVDLKFPLRAVDPNHKHFAPEYAKKGTQSHAEWEQDGKDGLHHGDDYDGEEFGEFAPERSRTDLDKKAIQAHPNWRSVVNDDELTGTIQRNLNWAKEVFAAKKPKPMENFVPRPWQADLLAKLDQPPDDRTILWIYDPKGAAGKTTLSNYLVRNKGATILAGKAVDMFYAYDMEPIVIVDIPRADNMEYLNYGAIEKLKDGVFFSGKYSSGLKTRDHNAHVLVFSNHEPDRTKWTDDRLEMVSLSEPEMPAFSTQFE